MIKFGTFEKASLFGKLGVIFFILIKKDKKFLTNSR